MSRIITVNRPYPAVKTSLLQLFVIAFFSFFLSPLIFNFVTFFGADYFNVF